MPRPQERKPRHELAFDGVTATVTGWQQEGTAPKPTDKGNGHLPKRSETTRLGNPDGWRPRHGLGSLRGVAVAARPAIRAYDLRILVGHFV
jgi:hypothetical protein